MKVPLIAAAFLAVLSSTSHAYTECGPVKLTKVWSDVQGDFYIAVNNGSLNGVIPSAAHPVTAKSAIAIALTAYTANRKVIIRYARDGISCDAPAWNEEISGIGMAGD